MLHRTLELLLVVASTGYCFGEGLYIVLHIGVVQDWGVRVSGFIAGFGRKVAGKHRGKRLVAYQGPCTNKSILIMITIAS